MTLLKDKVAVITGGSKGIGLATAQLFAKEGAKIVITSRNAQDLAKAKDTIDGEVMTIVSDVGQVKDLEFLFKQVHERFENIDVLFANAGIAARVWIGDVTEEFFDDIVNTNYKGAFFTVQKALPYLNKGSSVILNASIAGFHGFDHHSVYSSSKAAVIQLAKTIAADVAHLDIRVNAISPGYIRTPIWDQWLDNSQEKFHRLCNDVPFEHRFGKPEEIAQTALFLASANSGYITGQNITIDGGVTTLVPEFLKYGDKN